ncbi:hypothetical protein [Hymenobacter metallicola]|uniref:Uncharacterized protein n=1 Tax=Hymenobacter metallicola TaxID=2563114 RepID=A0A4Z0QIE6_9BACT|nr:hypothetical protein [Hymenobacter metallicola]TGE29770.1 hypothetical protein E5K02_10010 [Hymenobacter metallicola]
MIAEFEARLHEAFQPFLQQAQRRRNRIKALEAQPQTEATAKSIEIEKREVKTIVEAAKQFNALFADMRAAVEHQQQVTEKMKATLIPEVEKADYFETQFFRAVDALTEYAPELPDEKWPSVLLAGYMSILRVVHLRNAPATYQATYPTRYPMPAHA